jgi:hypothetical protein
MKYLALTLVTAAVSFSVQAADGTMSPKAREQADALKRVPGITQDRIDRSIPVGSAKARDLAASSRIVPGRSSGIDLAHAPRPLYSAKDPRFETALRNNAIKQFEVAPLK